MRISILCPFVLLAACSSETESVTNSSTSEIAATAPLTVPTPVQQGVPEQIPSIPEAPQEPVPTAATTTGGDGSPLQLSPLLSGDMEGLPGELGCSFALKQGAMPVLVGKADVAPDARAVAVIRIGDYPERLVSRGTGGFGAMERGTALGGRGMTVTVDPGERVSGGEAPTRRATLLAQRADGAERTFDGFWTCGP